MDMEWIGGNRLVGLAIGSDDLYRLGIGLNRAGICINKFGRDLSNAQFFFQYVFVESII